MWLMSASSECQQFLVLHIRQLMGGIVTYCQSECIGGRYSERYKWHARYHILKMTVNGASIIFGLVSGKIQRATRRHYHIIELSAAFLGKNAFGDTVPMPWKWASMERQQFLAFQLRQSRGHAATSTLNRAISRLPRQKSFRRHSTYTLKMTFNKVSTILGLASSLT